MPPHDTGGQRDGFGIAADHQPAGGDRGTDRVRPLGGMNRPSENLLMLQGVR